MAVVRLLLRLVLLAPAACRLSQRHSWSELWNASTVSAAQDGLHLGREHKTTTPEQLIVVHVGKTGGTTLKDLLLDTTDRSIVQWPRHSICIKKMAACSVNPHAKYIFLVRSPVHRYVSGWLERYKVRGEDEMGDDEKEAFTRFQTPNKLACALYSKDAEEQRRAQAAIQGIKHTGRDINAYMGGLENLRQCTDQVVWVGRTEHFDDDYLVLIKKLQALGVVTGHPKKHFGRDRVQPAEYNSLTELGRCAVESLHRWYEKDYEIIRYLAHVGLVDASYPGDVAAADAPPSLGQVAEYWAS